MNDSDEISIRVVKFSDVSPMPENPRIIDDVALKGLRASLDRFGYVEPIVWNERTGHIVGGHQRFKVLSMKGLIEAPMVIVDMDSNEEMAANLTLNNPEIEGEFDASACDLLQKMNGADSELFKNLRMDDLKVKLDKRFEPQKNQEFINKEIDIDKLVSGCTDKCPCCGFVWESDAKDQVDLEELKDE